ncbi:MAG: DUF3324 domain-containing protein [Enterococcaceae bacterium]|jgi:uncharacterized membrane protein|nr:DUF3324 domain-containing protein [Enterococcaceae bacterium]MCI1919598.1 DUF3324 domain-containing protein [Enterococcaceae bacterium]
MLKKLTILVFGLLLTIGILPLNVLAADDGSEVGFTITPHLQANQRNTGNSFFDLAVKPDEELDLSFDIINSSGKEQTFDIAVNPAYTNDAGQIDYVDSDHKRDATLKVDLAKIADYEKAATVAAGETKTVPLKIKVPAEAFQGEVLGGIHVTRRTAEGEQEGAQLVNKFAYVIGLKMTENETAIKRDLKLLDVNAGLSYHHTSVKAQMQNPEPTAMGHLEFDAKVTKKGSDKVIKEQKSKDLSMAPNSSFDYVIDWKNQELEAGDYHLALVVKDAQDNEWKFDKDFTITAKEAKKYNASAVELVKKDHTPWIYALVGLLLAIIVGFIIFLIIKRRKNEETEAEAK